MSNATTNHFPPDENSTHAEMKYYRVLPAANAAVEALHSAWDLKPGDALVVVPNGPFLSLWTGRQHNAILTDSARDDLISMLLDGHAIIGLIDNTPDLQALLAVGGDPLDLDHSVEN